MNIQFSLEKSGHQAYDLSNQMYFVQSLCFINKVGAPSIKVSIEINHEGL